MLSDVRVALAHAFPDSFAVIVISMADDEDHAARAASFGGVAEVYQRTRPDYPTAAVRWLIGERPVEVVDVGAGTGKLTRVMLAEGHVVTVVEPSEGMLAQLRAASPGVRALHGSGEALPLPDASADAVTYAQAWHWVDPERGSAEAARVLRPGGVLGLVWNLRRTDDALGAGLADLIGNEDAHAAYAPWGDDDLQLGPDFGPIDRATFDHTQTLDRDDLVGLVTSRSYVTLMVPAARADLLARVARVHDALAVDGVVTLRYETTAYRARTSR
jgi:SAM-dependent methyltransferase